MPLEWCLLTRSNRTISFFGPPGTGFRVALTGTALELDAKFEVVKKLKLVGYPDKIFKKTAFIKGMFNSDLEVPHAA